MVATLAEDDSVDISPYPGETSECREYPVQADGDIVLRFIDTPGFQNPRGILQWFRENGPEEPRLAGRFLEAHRSSTRWRHDCRLLDPIARGYGILYVLDGSRPVSGTDRIEMEILRLSGNPRMAVINPKEAHPGNLEEWKAACSQRFSAVRLFNAHRATFVERIALLESLRAIHQDWEEPLGRVVGIFRKDWSRRIRETAEIVVRLLEQAAGHTETAALSDPSGGKDRLPSLEERYRQSLRRMERQAHERIRRIYRHRVFQVRIPEQSVLGEDLFTSRTWQVLGLKRHQLASAGLLLGGGLGAKLDLMAAGLAFGAFTTAGALAGAAAVWLKGERLAQVRIVRQRIGRTLITVGPNSNPQFPFILIDRALLYFGHVAAQAHVVRQADAPLLEAGEAGASAGWSRSQRGLCVRLLSDRLSGQRRERLRQEFSRQLGESLRTQVEKGVPERL